MEFLLSRLASQQLRRWRNLFPSREKGVTLLELLVVIGVLGIISMIAIPALNSSMLDLSSASDELAANLKLARGRANGSGSHVRVTINANSYVVERLQDDDDDGVWMPDGSFPANTIDLPKTVSVTDGVGKQIEFNSRGLMDSPEGTTPAVVELTLYDSKNGDTKQIHVWPSGQVLEV
jgi:prepilin-type N-terminal cleavage/methylation domain-containing protein